MDAINAAVTAHVEQEVAALKVSLAKARSAAVGWRKRCDAMEIRALSAEGDYECEKAEYEDMTKEWAELEKKLLARAEKAEAELLKAQGATMPAHVIETKMPEVTKYRATDVFRNKNDVSQLGFDKNKSYDEMLKIAIENKCCIIVKDGSGKWYLKGQDMDFEIVKKHVEDANKRVVPRHKNVTLYLIKH